MVGSANIDLTTFTDRFPKPGETIFGQKFDLGFGGKGANQAVAARLCGADVFMVARVGSDLFGPATIENFKKLGIDATQVKQVEGMSSGVAPIFVDPNGQNRILVVKGANDALTPGRRRRRVGDSEVGRLHRAAVRNSARNRLLHGSFREQARYPLHSESCTGAAGRHARSHGLDYFVPNESEAETITGMPVRNVDDAKKCAQKLLGHGIRRVILTLGANGSLLAGARRHGARAGVPGEEPSTAPAPAMRSSEASRCFSRKGLPSARLCGARISTPACRPPGSARRNLFTIAPATTLSGHRDRKVRSRDNPNVVIPKSVALVPLHVHSPQSACVAANPQIFAYKNDVLGRNEHTSRWEYLYRARVYIFPYKKRDHTTAGPVSRRHKSS